MTRAILIVFMSLNLMACVSLLVPDVKSELKDLRAGNYQLDKSHASLLFKVQHLGLSTYVGRFNEFDASIEFDPENMQQAKLEALIDMASVDTNNAKLEKNLQGRDWFYVARYPQAHFKSQKAVKVSDSIYDFHGQLDWYGVNRPLVIQVEFHGGATNMLTAKYTLGFSAKTRFKRSDFGMDSYIPLVGDEIEIEAYAEFQKK